MISKEERVAEVAILAAKLGAIYANEYEHRAGGHFFKLSKPGFENRFISFKNLKKGRNPFSRACFLDQEVEAKKFAVEIGAKYIGHDNTGHRDNHFWFSKDGYDDRSTTLSNLRQGSSPFNKPTLNEQIVAVKLFAAQFGATYSRYEKVGSKSYFWLSKPGFDDRLVPFANLKFGYKPFNKPTVNEQILTATKLATKVGAVYKGCERINGTNHFRIAKAGYDDRLISLGSLKGNKDPFGMATISEQEVEVRAFATKLGITYENECKKVGKSTNLSFKFSKPGFEVRWMVLSSLRRGRDPFGRPTIGEQEKEMLMLIAKQDFTYANEYKKGSADYYKFKFSKRGRDDRWATLGGIRAGKHPFFRLTVNEQEAELRGYVSRFQAKYTGMVKKNRQGVNMFEISKPGYENQFIGLSSAKKAIDPFTGGGFDASKPGCNYVLLVTEESGAQCVKTGITNWLPSRLKAHTSALNSADATCVLLHKIRCKDGAKVMARERHLKKLFKADRTCVQDALGFEVVGFTCHGGECFDVAIQEQLIAALKKLSGSAKKNSN